MSDRYHYTVCDIQVMRLHTLKNGANAPLECRTYIARDTKIEHAIRQTNDANKKMFRTISLAIFFFYSITKMYLLQCCTVKFLIKESTKSQLGRQRAKQINGGRTQRFFEVSDPSFTDE
jgi:hypothetical protein